MGHHLADGLVVRNHARWWCLDSEPNRFAIDLDMITKLNALPNVRWFVVDRDSPLKNQLLHFKPRPHARLRENFMQLGRFSLRRQHALQGRNILQLFISVELSGHDIIEPIAGTQRRWHSNSTCADFRRCGGVGASGHIGIVWIHGRFPLEKSSSDAVDSKPASAVLPASPVLFALFKLVKKTAGMSSCP